MARPRKSSPSYLLHQKTGRGRLIGTDSLGSRQEKLLPGADNSPESLVEKARLELEILSSPAAGAGRKD